MAKFFRAEGRKCTNFQRKNMKLVTTVLFFLYIKCTILYIFQSLSEQKCTIFMSGQRSFWYFFVENHTKTLSNPQNFRLRRFFDPNHSKNDQLGRYIGCKNRAEGAKIFGTKNCTFFTNP